MVNNLTMPFAGLGDTVLVGNIASDTKATATFEPGDAKIPLIDLVHVNTSSRRIFVVDTAGGIPLPMGAPHEHYRFFSEKALGVAMYPDHFWDRGCKTPGHKFYLIGAGGSGSASTISASVRPGAQQGHMLQEAGHSIFQSCIYSAELLDPGLIFDVSFWQGGIEAATMDGCVPGTDDRKPDAPSFLDCRDQEHYFLAYNTEYRANGRKLRMEFNNATYGAVIRARYEWLKTNWYNGVEFYSFDVPVGSTAPVPGLQCLSPGCPN
jgi:hypothetical protein